MNNGVLAAFDKSVTDLIIVGDSRLAIQQFGGGGAARRRRCSPAAAANSAVAKTTARDDQSTWYFVPQYERRHWFVESSVLMGLHPDLNPSATPEALIEMFELWTRYKLTRKRRSVVLRSLVVSAYDKLYSAVTHQIGGQPSPLIRQ
ncbi:hypothetical protein PC117_g23276 [Phytophthora cactorum]|uniref:Uncharacterized protein n=1 Tax=Phytophthora cactorum TaxID=29920 RepID=A0A8T1B6V0_9STRA|nr:hypothetical protein PC117_g23276 [Phytophthora cactorum]